MDQQELDNAYTQINYAPNQPQILARYASNSAAMRARLGEPRRFAYGPAPIEQLDLYAAPLANAPICVFLHGGAWRTGAARNSAFASELFVRSGAHSIVLDFKPSEFINRIMLSGAGGVGRSGFTGRGGFRALRGQAS